MTPARFASSVREILTVIGFAISPTLARCRNRLDRSIKGQNYATDMRQPVLARVILLCVVFIVVFPAPGAPATVPDERDRQVLEAVLLRLLADLEFDMTRIPTNEAVLVLHTRTPEKTGFLMSHQIRSDIGNHTLPSDVEEDLRRRNTPRGAKPDTYDAVPAFYTNLTFTAPIVVADVPGNMGGRLSYGAFEQAHPKARGFARAYLPGYSKDGTRATVRASIGPAAHAAMVTALLEKRGDKWVVVWHHIAWYA